MMSRISGCQMNPAFTTSANPATSLVRRQRRRACRGRTTTARGAQNAPTRFLPSAVLIAGLAADGGVDHAEHGRRHLHDLDAAQPGRGDEAGEVGHRAPAEADDRVGAGEVGLPHDLPAERGDLDALALLGIGDLGEQHLARRRRPSAARAARRARAPSVGGCTISTLRTVGARALAERGPGCRGRRDVVARRRRSPRWWWSVMRAPRCSACAGPRHDLGDDRRERAARGVEGDVGDLFVQRCGVRRDASASARPGPSPASSGRSLAADPRRRRPRGETVRNTTRCAREVRACRGVEHRSAAERDDAARRERLSDRRALELAEVRLAVRREDRRDRPVLARRSSLSVSTNAHAERAGDPRPTLVLPAPIGPTRTIACGGRSAVRASCSMSAASDAVRSCAASPGSPRGSPRGCGASRATLSPPNFSSTAFGEHERHHRLGDDARGGDRADVGTLVVRGCGLAGRDVDRAQGVRDRRDRLHAGADAQHGAGRHAALGAAGAVARAGDAVVGREQLVVRRGAAPASS